MIRYPIEGTNVSKVFTNERFPAGEHNIFVKAWDYIGDIHDPVYFVVYSSGRLDMMEIGMKVDILRRKGYRNISLVLPYLAYSRQDRYTVSGYSFSLKVLANFINSLGLSKVYSVDTHSDVAGVIDNFYNIPINDCLKYVLNWGDSVETILVPDAGASKKIYDSLTGTGFDGTIAVCTKHRDVTTGNITHMEVPEVSGPVLVVDDICDGGRTFIEIAKQIPSCTKYLYVTHGIFSKETVFQHYNVVWTTNSIPHDTVANTIELNFNQVRRY